MKNIFLLFLFAFFVCSFNLHGTVVHDPYKWMEDINSRKVLRFARAENRNMRKAIKKTKKLHREFFKEVNNRQIMSRPGEELFDRPDGDYIYYTRSRGGTALHYRKKRDGSEMEELLIDEKKIAEKKDCELWSYEISPNRQHIAYILFHEDTEEWQLHLKQIYSNSIKKFLNVHEFVWVNDSIIIYSTYIEEHGRIKRLYMHKLGTPQSMDHLIYEEPDKSSYLLSVELSKSRKYIFVHICNSTSLSETRYMDMEAIGELKIFNPRENRLFYRVYHDAGDTVFYIRTNLNAPNFKMVKTGINHTESRYWIDFLPESDDFIMDVKSTGTHFVLSEYGNGSMKLSLLEKQSGKKHSVEFDEKIYNTELIYIDSLKKNIRFKYFSCLTPDTYYDYDYGAHQLSMIFETQVKNYRKDDYRVEYTIINSGDGYPVPVTIVHSKNTTRDGTAPVHMDIYGAYGVEAVPYFYLQLHSLLDRGFYFVMPDVRGGGGLYSKRHLDALVLQKKNTAYDMIAVAQFLISEKYTSAGKIHVTAQSAGGIALGMAVNMHPELFGSLIFLSPSLDVMFDIENQNERVWLEDGNPNIREELDNILEYSPYQNVKKQAYPAMQFATGLKDENVHPGETFKMVAKLRANQTGTAPIYMSTDFKGNHFGMNKKMIRPYIFKLAIHNNILP